MFLPDIIRCPALRSTDTLEKRMSLGAVLALMIGGTGASIPEVVRLRAIFKMPILVGFPVSVFGVGGPLVLKELDKGSALSYERGHKEESMARGHGSSRGNKDSSTV